MNLYFFGTTHGHLDNRAAKVAKRHGAELICYEEGGHDSYSIRRWCTFACPNRGFPYDQEIEAKVMADVEQVGGVEAVRKKFINDQEINEDWTEEDEEELQASSARNRFKRIINYITLWNAEDVLHLVYRLRDVEELISQAEKRGWDWLEGLREELTLALSARGEQADQDWPPPWDEDTCEFAWVVDNQGQYLAQDDYGQWVVAEWEDDVTCRFDACVADEDQKPE